MDEAYNFDFEEGETNEMAGLNHGFGGMHSKKMRGHNLNNNNNLRFPGDKPFHVNTNKTFNQFRKEFGDERKGNHHKNHSSKENSKHKSIITDELSFDEAERLLETWRRSNFVQFNNWVQISKSNLRMEYTPH